ncbi:MAG: c-type cytochrome [Thermoanaerobaculia bacterium]
MKQILVLLVLMVVPVLAFGDDAAALYKTKCAMCHGPAGGADTPMGKKLAIKPLASPDVQKNTDAQLTQVIAKGRNKMPAFTGKLSDAQVKALVALIRTFAPKK